MSLKVPKKYFFIEDMIRERTERTFKEIEIWPPQQILQIEREDSVTDYAKKELKLDLFKKTIALYEKCKEGEIKSLNKFEICTECISIMEAIMNIPKLSQADEIVEKMDRAINTMINYMLEI